MRASLKATRCMVCKTHTYMYWSQWDSAFPTIPLTKCWISSGNFEIITVCFISVALLQPSMGLCIGTSQAWPCVRGIKSHGICQDWAQNPTSTAFTSRETASSIFKPDETPSASSLMSLILSLWSQTALVCTAASQTHTCSSVLFLKEISVTNVCLTLAFEGCLRSVVCPVFTLYVSAHTIFVCFRSVWSGVTNSEKLSWWDESQLHSRKVWLLSESDWIHDTFKNILHCCNRNRLGLLSKPHLGDWDVPWSGEVQHCLHMCSTTCTCTVSEHETQADSRTCTCKSWTCMTCKNCIFQKMNRLSK